METEKLEEFKNNLYSKSWKETYQEKDVIVIEKSYPGARIHEIETRYKNNKEVFDKYFPRLIKVDHARKRFFFEYIKGEPLSNLLSLKKIGHVTSAISFSYTIGIKIAQFHHENIKLSSETSLLDEYQMRLTTFQEYYPTKQKQQEQLSLLIPKIEALKKDMVCIHHDLSPWNIMISSQNNIWFIDYFNSCYGLKYQDLWKFIFSIELLMFYFYPLSHTKKIIHAFLKGYCEAGSIEANTFFLVKIIYEMFYLTYLAKKQNSISLFFKKKYFEGKLAKDLDIYFCNESL